MATAVSNSVTLPEISNSNGTLTDEFINGLVQGASWRFGGEPRTITYSFNISDGENMFGQPLSGSLNPWTGSLTDAVNRAFAEWSMFANIDFQNIASGTYYYESNADIALSLTGGELQADGAVALGIFPDPDFGQLVRDAAAAEGLAYPKPEGDIFFDNFYSAYENFLGDGSLWAGSRGYEIVLHEIGHALGLKHPNDNGGNDRPTFAALGISAYDTTRWTIMSDDTRELSSQWWGYDASPMPLDVLAIQQIYGANTSFHTGDDVYYLEDAFYAKQVLGQHGPRTTVWDAGGIDTISAERVARYFSEGHPRGSSDGAIIDLRPGEASREKAPSISPAGEMYVAFGATIENAIGSSGSDTITGNALSNRLDGGLGGDLLAGGAGDDLYIIDNILDIVVENLNEGFDVVRSSASHALSANIETLVLTGANAIDGGGNASNNVLTGNTSRNVLEGLAGNDILDGGSGVDVMRGGAGNDTYVVRDKMLVSVPLTAMSIEYVEPGSSQLESRSFDASTGNLIAQTHGSNGLIISYRDGRNRWDINFGAGVSHNLHAGSYTTAAAPGPIMYAIGNGFSYQTGVGSFSIGILEYTQKTVVDNTPGLPSAPYVVSLLQISFDGIFGYYGGSILRGTATINLSGLALGDPEPVIENPNEGIDLVQSAISYALPQNVENLTLTGAKNLGGNGNTLDNILTGNTGDNVLSGGAGNDTLIGSAGNDTASYAGATAGVIANLALSLASNDGQGGTDTLIDIENLTGSSFNDNLTGNGGNNILNGGAGVDTMTGGDGSDIYYVRDMGDAVSETNATSSTGGTDKVYSYLGAYTLGAHVENGRIMSTGAANLTGNTLNNLLYAGRGDNVIAGGDGADTVSFYYGVNGTTGVTVSLVPVTAQATGGSGSDRLSGFEHLYGSNNADKLTGTTGANKLMGYDGNDTLDGGAGIDTMTGGDGSDIYYVRDTGDVVSETNATASMGGTDKVYSYLGAYTLGAHVENGRIMSTGAANLTGNTLNNLLYAGKGDNVISGGDGVDIVSFYYGVNGTTGVTVSLVPVTAQATGGSGSDTLSGIEHLYGTINVDKLTGNSVANRLTGYDGNDTISAGGGNDTLTGGAGKDSLTGGSGNDIFDYNTLLETGLTNTSWDVINDFVIGQDKIDLTTLDANTATTANDAFTSVIASGALFTAAGQLRYESGVLYGNTDADSAAEFAIQLAVGALSTSDFFL